MRYIVLIFILATLSVGVLAHQKILEKDINVLTLYKGQYTTSSRASSVLQLECVGGNAKREAHRVSSVQCYNKGFDGKSTNWKCESQLPSNLKFGKLSVSCEGYASKYDAYVLVGSCGLRYELSYVSLSSQPDINFPEDDSSFYWILIFPISTLILLLYLGGCCEMFCSSNHYDNSAEVHVNPHPRSRAQTTTTITETDDNSTSYRSLATTTTRPMEVLTSSSPVILSTTTTPMYGPVYNPLFPYRSPSPHVTNIVSTSTTNIVPPLTRQPAMYISDHTPTHTVTHRANIDTSDSAQSSIGYATTERRGDDYTTNDTKSDDDNNNETEVGFATTDRR